MVYFVIQGGAYPKHPGAQPAQRSQPPPPPPPQQQPMRMAAAAAPPPQPVRMAPAAAPAPMPPQRPVAATGPPQPVAQAMPAPAAAPTQNGAVRYQSPIFKLKKKLIKERGHTTTCCMFVHELFCRDVRVQILIWFKTFLLFTKPHFQTFNAVRMHWKAHLFRHFRLFQTFSHRRSHTAGSAWSYIRVIILTKPYIVSWEPEGR